jgi:hypothetical protein
MGVASLANGRPAAGTFLPFKVCDRLKGLGITRISAETAEPIHATS